MRQLSLNEIIMAASNSHGSNSNNNRARQLVNSTMTESNSGSAGGSNSLTMSISMISNEKDLIKINIVETERVVNQEALNEDVKCHICHGILMQPMECI